MGKRSKRDKFSNADAFGEDKSKSSVDLGDFSRAIYSSIADAEVGYDSIEPISIFDIDPDPTQPRQAIPFAVRQRWSRRRVKEQDIFEIWCELIAEERGDSFDVMTYLSEDDEVERPEAPGPLERGLMQITALAASIRSKGLTNPITLARHNGRYTLETGERRWMAHHLLNMYYPDEKWDKIPARVVDQVDVWRQAAENGARQNLNAISIARQLAMLIMEMYRDEREENLLSFESATQGQSTDRDYYAQVSDGNTYRILKGYGDLILNVTGLKSKYQISQYRALLELPDYFWQVADDLNWTEGMIRQLRNRAGGNDRKQQQLVAHAAHEEGYDLNSAGLEIDVRTAKAESSPQHKEWKRAKRAAQSVQLSPDVIAAWKAEDPDGFEAYVQSLVAYVEILVQ